MTIGRATAAGTPETDLVTTPPADRLNHLRGLISGDELGFLEDKLKAVTMELKAFNAARRRRLSSLRAEDKESVGLKESAQAAAAGAGHPAGAVLVAAGSSEDKGTNSQVSRPNYPFSFNASSVSTEDEAKSEVTLTLLSPSFQPSIRLHFLFPSPVHIVCLPRASICPALVIGAWHLRPIVLILCLHLRITWPSSSILNVY